MRPASALVAVCLGLLLAIAADARDRTISFYRGLEAEPVYSTSRVDQTHGRYQLEPALQGDTVRHDFLIGNDSEAVLELRDVQGCSGCIVESYSRSIAPGRTGKISVLFLTDSRGSQEIKGTIRAATSDVKRHEISIDVSLFVKEFASISPYRIWLKGSPDEEIVETCTVVPNPDYPFSITGIKVRKGVWFTHSYREIEKDGKRSYEITVRNTRKKAGPYQDVLFVQTDNSTRPEFKIRIEGRIQE